MGFKGFVLEDYKKCVSYTIKSLKRPSKNHVMKNENPFHIFLPQSYRYILTKKPLMLNHVLLTLKRKRNPTIPNIKSIAQFLRANIPITNLLDKTQEKKEKTKIHYYYSMTSDFLAASNCCRCVAEINKRCTFLCRPIKSL